MLRKATYRIAIYLLTLLALLWASRILFVFQLGGLSSIAQILDYKYLYISLLFDLKTIAIWFLPVFFLSLLSQWISHKVLQLITGIFIFTLSLALLLFNFTAVLYYPITKTIVGKDLFHMIAAQESHLVWSYIASYWYLVLLLLVVCFALSYFLAGIRIQLTKKQWWLVVPILCLSWALAARGSLRLKPLNHLDAYAALPNNQAVSAMNPSFVLLESLFQHSLEEYPYLDEKGLARLQSYDQLSYEPLFSSKPNICIILLESFGKEYSGLHGLDRPSYTPFLDSLAEQSVTFNNAFSNGLRSMDAVSSIYNGVPTLMRESFVGSVYAHIQLNSVFKFLKSRGYYSSFFHAADEGSMGFKSYLTAQGLDEYFAEQQYPNKEDHDGHWGILDQPYFQYVANQLATQAEPWFSSFFSLSSHHPYIVPEGYDHLEDGSLEIHRSIRYTDESLRDFFSTAMKQSWFNRTIFIITADHSSINETKEFSTMSGKYEVPLLIYGPSFFKPQKVDKAVQHIDIQPTIWHLIGKAEAGFSFGQSLLDSTESTVVHFDGAVYSITDAQRNMTWAGEEVLGFYNQVEDRQHENWIENEEFIKGQMMFTLKSRIQNFNRRILSNTYH